VQINVDDDDTPIAKRARSACAVVRDSPETIAAACARLTIHALLVPKLEDSLTLCAGQQRTSLLLEKRSRAPPGQHVVERTGARRRLQTYLARLTKTVVVRRQAIGRSKYTQDMLSAPKAASVFSSGGGVAGGGVAGGGVAGGGVARGGAAGGGATSTAATPATHTSQKRKTHRAKARL